MLQPKEKDSLGLSLLLPSLCLPLPPNPPRSWCCSDAVTLGTQRFCVCISAPPSVGSTLGQSAVPLLTPLSL